MDPQTGTEAGSVAQGGVLVIWVTRLNGSEIVLNADLIETVEATPDTIITLVDGKKYVVSEAADEVVNRIRLFRASILTMAETPLGTAHARERAESRLYVLPTGSSDDGD